MRLRQSKFAAVSVLFGICLLLVGCLPFPLGSPETSTIDNKLAGYWWAHEEDQHTLIMLYPYDAHTYVVHTAEFKKNGDKLEPTNIQIYKGWLTQVKGARFITLDPLVQHLPTAEPDKRWYMVARLIPEGDGMRVKGLDPDFEPLKSVTSAAEEAKIISENLEEPKLYGNNATHYKHLDPEKDQETLKPLIELFK